MTEQLEQQNRRILELQQQAEMSVHALANAQVPPANGHGTPSDNGRRTGDLDLANDARAIMKQQRKAAIPEVLAAVGMPLSTGELRDRLLHMHGWEVSADSVRRYCQELAAEGIVESERRKWQLADRRNLADAGSNGGRRSGSQRCECRLGMGGDLSLGAALSVWGRVDGRGPGRSGRPRRS